MLRWSERQESNLRLTACKAVALPTELHSDCFMASQLGFEPRLQGFGDLLITVILLTYIWRRLTVSRRPCLGCNQVHICLCQVVICMAERAGLEPATHGIKIRCTTFVLPLNCFGGGGWSRTNNVYLSEQIYSLPQHHRRCRPS